MDKNIADEADEVEILDLYDLYVRTETLPRDNELLMKLEEVVGPEEQARIDEAAKRSDRKYELHYYFRTNFSNCYFSDEENFAFGVSFQMTKNIEMRDRLILGNILLAGWFAKNFLKWLDFNDCVQWATIGLFETVKKWLPEKDAKFSTYAFWWMKQTAKRSHEDTRANIRIPVHITELENKIRSIQKEMVDSGGQLSLITDPVTLIPKVNLGKKKYSPKQVYRVLWSITKPDISLEELEFGGRKEVFHGLNPEQVFFARAEVSEACALIRSRVLEKLSFKQKRDTGIFRMFYGLDGTGKQKTLIQVGWHYGITRERVRQIVERGWRVLRRRKIQENKFWFKAQIRKIHRIEALLGDDFIGEAFAHDHPTEMRRVLIKDSVSLKKHSRFVNKETTAVFTLSI